MIQLNRQLKYDDPPKLPEFRREQRVVHYVIVGVTGGALAFWLFAAYVALGGRFW